MDLSVKGAAVIQIHEGFVPRWYADPTGTGTIGTGFTWLSDSFRKWWAQNKPGVKFGPGATMTRAEAADALVKVVHEEYGAAVNKFLGDKTIPQHQFDGIVSVVFNCGAATLGDQWAGLLRLGRIHEACERLKTTRVTSKGKRLAGLVSRRREEAELIELADYTIAGRSPVVSEDPMEDGMLVKGERGDAVRELQAKLFKLGHYDGKVDGIFGVGTQAAVMAFQNSVNLKADGFAGPLTLTALDRAMDAPTPTPVPPVTPVPIVPTFPEPPVAGTATTAPIAEADVVVVNKDLSPVEMTNKANKGAIAAGAGTGGAGMGIMYLWLTSGYFPEMWANDPKAVAIITTLVAIPVSMVTAWLGAYFATDKRFATLQQLIEKAR